MISYNELSKHSRRFLAMTGYTVEEFQALLPHFQVRFEKHVETHTLDGKSRAKRQYSAESVLLPIVQTKFDNILAWKHSHAGFNKV